MANSKLKQLKDRPNILLEHKEFSLLNSTALLCENQSPWKFSEIQTSKDYRIESVSHKATFKGSIEPTSFYERSPVKNCPGHYLCIENELMKTHQGSFFHFNNHIRENKERQENGETVYYSEKGLSAFLASLIFLILNVPCPLMFSFKYRLFRWKTIKA